MILQGKRILVTGGAGFIGSHIVDSLVKQSAHVIVYDDFRKGDLPVGPPDKQKISPKHVIKELEKAGFVLTQHQEDLPYQYMLTFKLGDY